MSVPAITPDVLTYEPFFGLNEKPFSLDTDPRFLYASPTHDAARKGLVAGIRRREGLLVLTGEIGMGKTTLCRTVLRELGRNTFSSLVPDPFAAREDLLKMLLIDFGVLSTQDVTEGHLRQASRTELGYLLSDFLKSLPRDAYAVVMLDEAQNLSLPLIEETRILFDSFGARGRLQILFVGQPELHAKLKLPEMRQVDQRVCGYYRLAAMNAEAVAGYVEHRLHVAGGDPDRILFPPAMIEALHKRTGGVPRLINRVCDRALQLAYEHRADAVNQEVLDAALIEVGAVTLSPTWDAIMFAEGPAPATNAALVSAVPEPFDAPSPVEQASELEQPAQLEIPVPHDVSGPFESTAIAAAAQAQDPEPGVAPSPARAVDYFPKESEFQKEVEDWVQEDLAPPARPTPVFYEAGERTPPARQRRVKVRVDWPRGVRSETYVQKVSRTWAARVAIGMAAFLAVNILMAGAFTLLAGVGPSTPPALPALPAAPAKQLPSVELPDRGVAPSAGVVFVGNDARSAGEDDAGTQ